jgi:hypothetical protein
MGPTVVEYAGATVAVNLFNQQILFIEALL